VNQAVSICAHPESHLAVGMETTRMNVGNWGILDQVSGNAEHSGSQNDPQKALSVLIGPVGSRCGRAKRAQPRQRLVVTPQKPFVSGIPHRFFVVLEYVKDVGFMHT
jgi:hypothetical protein